MNCLTSLFCCGCDDETGEDKTNKTAIINNKNNNNELNSKNNQLIPSIINNTININNETKQKLYQECQELIKQKEILQQECQELIKQKENLEQELNKLEEMEEEVIKKVLGEEIIDNVRRENIKMIEEEIDKVDKKWSSEKEKKDKKITELMMENFTIQQKVDVLESTNQELKTKYNEIYEVWQDRIKMCEQYQNEINNLKKKILEYMNAKKNKPSTNLPTTLNLKQEEEKAEEKKTQNKQ